METFIVIITLVIIILLAIKKDYKELLIFLIISLIIDWIFVNTFSTIPIISVMAVLVGKPVLSVLVYIVIELICMGIFYYVLQKSNYIISLIVYLVINLIISKFYITISGSVLLDLYFNFIIGIIIIIVYRKNIKMIDIKYFSIIGMIIDTILAFFITYIWKIVGGTIFVYISFLGLLFMPYIIGGVLSAIIIYLIRKKLIKKDKKYTIIAYVMIILICGCISVKAGYAFLLYESARPDKLYTQINEINNNQSLIGLSKEKVVELLGNPYKEIENEDTNIYEYDAGKISNRLFFGESNFYTLIIFFDETDIVKFTSIEQDI